MATTSTTRQSAKDATAFTTSGEREVRMERVFNAPPARLFEAYTDPRQVPLWWGPRGSTTEVDRMDVEVGGRWRYLNRGRDGVESGFRGEYREIVPGQRIVSTFEFEPQAGHVSVDTATFEDV